MRSHESMSGKRSSLPLWPAGRSFLRRLAVVLCRGLLRIFSRHYALSEGVTLVFAPHQDDETLGCGGLIARQRSEGLAVHVAFITDGRSSHRGHPRLTPDETAALRHTEALEALAVLGVESNSIHFLDERDGELNRLDPLRRAALVEKLTTLINDVRPDEIFLPSHRDGSDEHGAAFTHISEAIRRSRHQTALWQYLVWAWWKPCFLIENLLLSKERRRLPMEDFQSQKIRALACHRTQVQPMLPWVDPVLPPELQAVREFEEEYFFRFNPSVPPEAAEPVQTVV